VREPRVARISGFTMLELLVVLVIGSLAVAVVGVGTQAIMERSRFHEAVQGVNALLHAARALAVKSGSPVVVTFDPATQTLASPVRHFEISMPVHVRWTSVSEHSLGRQKSPTPVVFTFAQDGSGSGGPFQVLRSGRGVSFRINWLMGSIEQSDAAYIQ
jgi:general secretion pathway protein H